MTLADLLQLAVQISALLFVVSSMLAMGLSLTVNEIVEPLRNMRLVILALVANFILVPALAYILSLVLGLDSSLQAGLMILAMAAGAPFLPKLVQGAKGNVALSVGLMVLLMVVTIIYLPIALPLVLEGVSVNAWDIAQSLILLMLVPLLLGLFFRSHSPDSAEKWQPFAAKVSSVAILIMLVIGLGLNVPNIIALLGTRGILALLLFIAGSFAIGFLLGGRDASTRDVMALGTAQRNVSAALVVTAQNFADTAALPLVLVGAIVLLLILLPAAKRLGSKAADVNPEPA